MKTVAVVEDNADNRLLLQAILDGLYDVVEYENGVDALVQRRLAEIGLPPGTVEKMFEFIDLDEGRLKPGQK